MTESWRFFRAGGFDQARLETGAEIASIGALDQKLWVALSCPISGIEFDEETLALLDSDRDGHIRAGEIIDAVNWTVGELADPQWLGRETDTLPLSAIREGSDILASARHILKSLGKENAAEISLADCICMRENFSSHPFNGDGLIPVDAGRTEAEKRLISEIADCYGTGVSMESVQAFFSDVSSLFSWRSEADETILPLGADTFEAAAAWNEVKDKVEDYFRRCRLAGYDSRAEKLINRPEEDFVMLASRDLSREDEAIAAFPLATAAAGKSLPLTTGLNPLWTDAMCGFRERAVLPLLGHRDDLSEPDWIEICKKLSAFEIWMKRKPSLPPEKLGEERIREIALGNERAGIEELIGMDLALEPEMKAIASTEKLLRHVRHLSSFVNNFVSFRDFYTRRDKAIFQAGTLYLDGRSCELCVIVPDIAKHAALATLSRICLVYCDLVRGKEKMTIAAAFTAGDSDQLMMGRNGVFYDRKGQDWDATIVRIIEHPISLRQAFTSPYKMVGKMVGEQIQKIAASRTRTAQENAAKAILTSGTEEAKKFDAGKFAGIFAAIGLAIGAIGTALASILTGLLGLKLWQIPIAILCLALVISGPSVLIAWMKLRQRNLGPILDANGWAINARAKINIPFGTSLTQVAKLPEGSERSNADPYAEKSHAWIGYLALVVALLAAFFLFRRG